MVGYRILLSTILFLESSKELIAAIEDDVMVLQPVDTSSNDPADLLVCRRFQVGGSK
jgi:hypothetical protein